MVSKTPELSAQACRAAQIRIASASALDLLRLDDLDVQFDMAQQVERDNLTASATAARVNRYKFAMPPGPPAP
jgi:hypothetical protein